MRYIKVKNNAPIEYSIEQLFMDHPDAEIYKNTQMPNEQLLANYDVYPLITTSPPELHEDEQAEEAVPEFRRREWHQTWKVRKLTQEEVQQIIDRSECNTDEVELDIDVNFLVEHTVQQQRYKICNTCSEFTALKTCRECNCIIPLKIKIASAACPLKKW